uniref:Endonuclease n=1 Tax=Meloidogyne floridensis TaxID=298350 RepID=A0A915PD88_9BILA
DYILSFNRRKRIPNFVLEVLTMEKSRLIRPTGRLSWMPDPEFSLKFQPKYGDYDNPRRFELGHGHLATAFLHPHQQGFYLTNSVPQLDQVNGGHWRVIEEYISCLTRQVEETFIYTGPLFLPNEKTNLMEFQVLGPKEIFVPTHLFKVVILKISDKDAWKYWLESYVLTNTNLDELFDEKQSKLEGTEELDWED